MDTSLLPQRIVYESIEIRYRRGVREGLRGCGYTASSRLYISLEPPVYILKDYRLLYTEGQSLRNASDAVISHRSCQVGETFTVQLTLIAIQKLSDRAPTSVLRVRRAMGNPSGGSQHQYQGDNRIPPRDIRLVRPDTASDSRTEPSGTVEHSTEDWLARKRELYYSMLVDMLRMEE